MYSVLMVLITIVSANAEISDAENLSNMKKWAILTPTYGIDLSFDLTKWVRLYISTPYAQSDSHGPYFQCFESRDVLAYCESGDTIPDPHLGGIPTAFSIDAFMDNGRVEAYFARKMMTEKQCQEFTTPIRKMLKNSQHICLGGEATGYNFKEDGLVRLWVWDRATTKNHRESWWPD